MILGSKDGSEFAGHRATATRESRVALDPNLPSPFFHPASDHRNMSDLTSRPWDSASLSNFADVLTQHIHLDWEIDWTKQLIHGVVTIRLKPTGKEVDQVVLDSSYLDVQDATVGGQTVKVREMQSHRAERGG